MNSTKDLLHRIADTSLTKDEQAQLRCKLSAQLEEGGNYDAAREALGQFWRGVGERPLLHDLSEQTAAEVLLRAGALTSDIGSASQIEGAQDAAQDLLSESLSLFDKVQLLPENNQRTRHLSMMFSACISRLNQSLRRPAAMFSDPKPTPAAKVLCVEDNEMVAGAVRETLELNQRQVSSWFWFCS